MKKNLLLVSVLVCALLVFFGLKNKKSEAPMNGNLETGTQIIKEEMQNTPELLGYISKDQVGIFKINAPVPTQDVLSKNGYSIEETTASAEGHFYKLYVVSKDSQPMLTFILPYADVIYNIQVKSSEFRTSESIAVGSTMSDFIKAYPNYRLWYTAEEGEKFILNTAKDAGTPQFFLDRSDLVNRDEVFYKTGIKASDFKADAKINNIRVY